MLYNKAIFSRSSTFSSAVLEERTSDMDDSMDDSNSVSSLSLSSENPFTNSKDSGAPNMLSDGTETPRWLQGVSDSFSKTKTQRLRWIGNPHNNRKSKWKADHIFFKQGKPLKPYITLSY